MHDSPAEIVPSVPERALHERSATSRTRRRASARS